MKDKDIDIALERTPAVIAAEINMIKHLAAKLVLANFIEIGRRLTEAEGLLVCPEIRQRCRISGHTSLGQ